jgi:hypothetical protein
MVATCNTQYFFLLTSACFGPPTSCKCTRYDPMKNGQQHETYVMDVDANEILLVFLYYVLCPEK